VRLGVRSGHEWVYAAERAAAADRTGSAERAAAADRTGSAERAAG
jgi:hypothetical protein